MVKVEISKPILLYVIPLIQLLVLLILFAKTANISNIQYYGLFVKNYVASCEIVFIWCPIEEQQSAVM